MAVREKHTSAIHFLVRAVPAVLLFVSVTGITVAQEQQVSRPATAPKSSFGTTPGPSRNQSSSSQSPMHDKQDKQDKQKTFSSPENAAAALYEAAKNHDENTMLIILGPDNKDVIFWIEDPSVRKNDIDQFAKKYGEMHRLVREPDDETTLYIGAENWPLPIPLVERNGVWYFDADLGKQEILFRRIGENELDTVDNLHALVDAENEFHSRSADPGSDGEYAARLDCDPGKHDGLYWSDAKNPDDSPIGPYVARAAYNRSDRKPLHGYYFRILAEQGSKAHGGARKYMVDGKMTGGFAFVAFPAEYRSSGVETFIVNQDGKVYEKDLGPMTTQLASAMKSYNPDSTWNEVR